MSDIDKIEQAEYNGFRSYPNARIDYPPPSEPRAELAWIKGWERGRRTMLDKSHNVFNAYVSEREGTDNE